MPLLKRKTVQPTREERLQALHARANNARSIFTQAADDLDAASAEKIAVSQEMEDEALDLHQTACALEDSAFEVQDSAREDQAAADKIRNLFA